MERIAVNQAFRQAVRALGRFPLVIAVALAGTAAALWLNHLPLPRVEERTMAGNLVMTFWLGVPFLFALALTAESLRWPVWAVYVSQALGVAALGGFYYTLLTTPYPVR